MNTTENPNNTTTTIQPSISTIAIKLPQIWENNVISWFVIVESQFINSRITNDNTKYHHIIASLNESIVSKFIHIITKDFPKERYNTYAKSCNSNLYTKYPGATYSGLLLGTMRCL